MSENFTLHHGDCREVMATFAADSIDAVVCDPPYGLSFMGKGWDHGVPGVAFWTEALRVAKPGAYLLAFGGTRTYHRLAVAIEDAGWEIRDTIMWVYGSGFPKSHNLDGDRKGWGTALKPAHEPIIVARKPLARGLTVAANVLRYGTGAINVDGCRIEGANPDTVRGAGGMNGAFSPIGAQGEIIDDGLGRWPANVIHDGSDEVVACFTDGAARFFYCAKASREDREAGLREAGLREAVIGTLQGGGADANDPVSERFTKSARNIHPTVKPNALMRYLCRLVTPPGGIVLDPFMGSGSTGKSAVLEGFRFIGIEREAEYCDIARARIEAAAQQQDLFHAP